VPRLHRRRFIGTSVAIAGVSALAGCGLVAPPGAPPTRIRRIDYLAEGGHKPGSGTLGALAQPAYFAFRDGLRDLGHVEGESLELTFRVADVGKEAAYVELATELAASRPDLLSPRRSRHSPSSSESTRI
jgi:hypothetical protein